MANTNHTLSQAKENKNDEFYTQLPDIENELRHYKQHFKGKVVLCNCDDPRVSNFFKYFAINFEHLGLKKLIATCYKSQDLNIFSKNDSEKAVYIIYEGDKNHNFSVDSDEIQVFPLKGDGDFRSEECINLLKEADIVCTNPPFSLFTEYITQLVEYDKKFLILGRMSAVHYSDVFPLLKDNKVWLGYGFNLSMIYKSPYKNTNEKNREYVRRNGYDPDENYIKVPAITWFTNLETPKHYEDIILFRHYSKEDYLKYDNFDGIDVSTVKDIPCDYDGYMGVPDSFLGQYNPNQFELIGVGCGNLAKTIGVTKNYRGRTDVAYTKNGKPSCPYSRVIIKKKQD